MATEESGANRSGVEAIVLSTADEGSAVGSSKELWRPLGDGSHGSGKSVKHPPGDAHSIQHTSSGQPDERHGQLRKTQSAHDIHVESVDDVHHHPGDARRRMSISAAPPFSADSSETHNSSRRSSAASIIISLSRPDSPIPQILQRPEDDDFFPESVEFLKLRKTVTAVQSVARFTRNRLHPSSITNDSQDDRDSSKSVKSSRRSSSPAIPKLDLSNEDGSKWTKVDDIRKKRGRRRSSTGSDVQAFCRPASRPSSAVAGIAPSRPSSSATIVQLGKLSRPWTPARSPSPGSPSSSQQQLWCSTGRPNFRSRSPGAISAPLQALNQKVNNILSSAANILDFYQLRPDLKKGTDPLRKARLEKSKWMNDHRINTDAALAKLEKLRNLPVGPIDKDSAINTTVTKLPPINLPTLPPLVMSQKKLPAHEKVFGSLKASQAKKPVVVKKSVAKTDVKKAGKSGEGTPEKKTDSGKRKSKGIALLKSLIANRTPAAAAAAFVGKKSLPLPAKARMTKVLRIRRQFRRPSRNKNQSNQNNQTNQNTGPPTLVNFFKRSKPTDRSQPIKYETYTDKDRAAAVLLGDADIKTTLEKQLKSERGRYVLPKESPAQVYLAQADFEMRIGGLATAKGLLNKALELQPGDKHALVCRSRCRLQMGDMGGALVDAEEALNKDPNYVKATYQKAEVLYQMGRFEEALVFYHMGGKQRPDMELFQQGVRKAQEAIEVSLGVKQPSIQQQLQQRTKKKSSKVPPLNFNKSNWRNASMQRDSSQLLGELHVDKLYLEKLIQHPGLHNPILPSQKIIHHAKETLEYLRARENFWRQQQPANMFYLPPIDKPKLRTKKKRRAASTTPTSTSFGASSDGSVTEREHRTPSNSTSSNTDEENRLSRMSGGESDPEAQNNPPTVRRSSSEEVHRILAGSNGLLPEEDFLAELRQAVQDMSECYQNQQWNRIVHIYLTQCWRGPSGVDDLTEEIEGKLGQLKLQEEQRIQQSLKPDDTSNTVCEMMQLTIDIAMLYLANGQEELARSFALRGTRLAQEANDKCGIIQVNLLMAALTALSADGPEISVYLARARQSFAGGDADGSAEPETVECEPSQQLQSEGNIDDFTSEKSENYEEEINHLETTMRKINMSDTTYDEYDENDGDDGDDVDASYVEEDDGEYDDDIFHESSYQEPDIAEEDEDEYTDSDRGSAGNDTLFEHETSGSAKQQFDD